MNESTEKPVVKSGTFLYGGLRICKVRIVKTDFWPGSGDYEDPPEFQADKYGEFYEVQYTALREKLFSPHSYHESLEEAVASVEKAATGVEWDKPN